MKTTLIQLLPLVAIVAITSCGSREKATTAEQTSAPLVLTERVVERSYTPAISYTGTVFAHREANRGATVPGRVEKIFFEEGQNVRKGDLIVELSDEMLTQATIEYETIKKDFERVSRLREKGSISEMEYDHVKAKYEASQAKVEMVRKNTRVHAPFSGVLVEKMMEEGEVFFINPGLEPGYSMRSGIVRLMQLDPVRVKFDVNEKDLKVIKKGLAVTVTLDGIAGKEFNGRIDNIRLMLSTTTHSAPVEVALSNPSLEVKPGMFAYVSVKLPEAKATCVPLKSIYRMPGTSEDYVYVVKQDIVHRVRVEQLETLGDYVAVKGLEPNSEVIVEGKNRVSEGLQVQVSRK
jgi:membrane fusion protein (multidrug efflux system)